MFLVANYLRHKLIIKSHCTVIMNDARKNWNETYKKQGSDVPWYVPDIPTFFMEQIGQIAPTTALEIGCGYGQYANYLAEIGFTVTATDFSKEAIKKAREIQSQKILFLCMDALKTSTVLHTKFEFIYDISLFHHLTPKNKIKYANQVQSMLSDSGTYMMCAFDTEDRYFEGKKEMFSDVSNTTMYPVTEEIIRETFQDRFRISKLERITWGKEYDKKRWLAIMRKK